MLPIAAGLAILLLIIAVIAGVGLSGTSWFDRSHAGFAPAQSLFGGNGPERRHARDGHAAADPGAGAPDRVRDARRSRRAGTSSRRSRSRRRAARRLQPAASRRSSAAAREPAPPASQPNSAAGGTRTHTSRRTVPFEGTASTDSATAALGGSLVVAPSSTAGRPRRASARPSPGSARAARRSAPAAPRPSRPAARSTAAGRAPPGPRATRSGCRRRHPTVHPALVVGVVAPAGAPAEVERGGADAADVAHARQQPRA